MKHHFTGALLTYQGRAHTVAEWAAIVGLKVNRIYQRMLRGWSVEDALTKPSKHGGARRRASKKPPAKEPAAPRAVVLTWNGRTQNLLSWARELGIKPVTMYKRRQLGWTPEEMLTTGRLRLGKKRIQRRRLTPEEWQALQQRRKIQRANAQKQR